MPFDTNLRNSSEAKQRLGPYQEGVKKALRQAGEKQASEALMNNIPPQHIEKQAGLSQDYTMEMLGQIIKSFQGSSGGGRNVMQDLNTLASTPVNEPGTIKGPFIALKDLMTGKGFNPLAPQQTSLGLDTATKIMGLQQSIDKDSRQVPIDAISMLKGLIDIKQSDPAFKAQMIEQEVGIKEGRLGARDIFNKFEEASKPFVEARDGFSRLQNVLKNEKGDIDFSGKNPAADLDLLFGTAKTLDPGGRVTDSDIAIQQAVTGAYGDRFKKIAQKIKRRGTLTPEERKFLYITSEKRFRAAEKEQKKTTDQFSQLAKENKVDKNRVIRDTGISNNLPFFEDAPEGAKGWDSENGKWVF